MIFKNERNMIISLVLININVINPYIHATIHVFFSW
jgi:hypothetical protein